MGRAEHMGVINQGREKTREKNVWKTMQNMKMSEHKKMQGDQFDACL
jgi:hypothetical protein